MEISAIADALVVATFEEWQPGLDRTYQIPVIRDSSYLTAFKLSIVGTVLDGVIQEFKITNLQIARRTK